MKNQDMILGYILRYYEEPNGQPKFKLKESSYTRKITSKSDRVHSKMLLFPVDYEEILMNTDIMETRGLILISEPFILNKKLKEKCLKWIENANNSSPEEYDFLR